MSLSDEASLLIRNISVTGDNFPRVRNILVNRYQNKRVLIDNHLAALFLPRQGVSETAVELKTLLNETENALGALEALCDPGEAWDYTLVYVTARKLDSASFKDWELQIGAKTEPPSFQQLKSFLTSRIRALETVEQRSGSLPTKKVNPQKGSSASGAKVHQTNVGHARKTLAQDKGKHATACSLCNAAHYISAYPDYRAKTSEQRRAILIDEKLCFNCLGSHQVKACRSQKRCQLCTAPHHTTIHRNGNAIASAPVATTVEQPRASTSTELSPSDSRPCPNEVQREQSISSNVALFHHAKHTPVLLATALVQVTSSSGYQYEVRALLDRGSEVPFISENLALRLNHPQSRVSLPIKGIGGTLSTVCRGRVTLNIASRLDSDVKISVKAYILSKLTSYTPPVRTITSPWSHLRGLTLADPGFTNAKSIDLVLGAEVYGAILEEGINKGDSDSPTAQNTLLGWILSGSVSSNSENQQPFASGLQCSVDHELTDLLQKFWVQEEVRASHKALLLKEEIVCERHFDETHSRSPDGRYTVRLPLKNLPDDLGESKNPAQLTPLRQEKRFTGNLELKDAYLKFLAEYEQLGHIQLVSPTLAMPQRVFYLPHHAVLRESSTTTKIRVVFNGSFRPERGISINDLQHVGPKLQLDLADIITRWRLYGYVFIADIEKMYRQIRVHPKDWDLQ